MDQDKSTVVMPEAKEGLGSEFSLWEKSTSIDELQSQRAVCDNEIINLQGEISRLQKQVGCAEINENFSEVTKISELRQLEVELNIDVVGVFNAKGRKGDRPFQCCVRMKDSQIEKLIPSLKAKEKLAQLKNKLMEIVAIERQIQKKEDEVKAKEMAIKCLDSEIAKMQVSPAPSGGVVADKPDSGDEPDWFADQSATSGVHDVEPESGVIFSVDVPATTVADDPDDRTPIDGIKLANLGMIDGDFIPVDRGNLPTLGRVISYKDLPDDMQKSLQYWDKLVIETLNRSTTIVEVKEIERKLSEQIRINEKLVRQLETLKNNASASRRPEVLIDYDRQLIFGLNLEQVRARISAFINSLLRAEKEELMKQRDAVMKLKADLEIKFDTAIAAYSKNEERLIATIGRVEEEKSKLEAQLKKVEEDLDVLLKRFDQLEAREKADVEKGIQSSRSELGLLMAVTETAKREYERKLAELGKEEFELRTKKAELDEAQREVEKIINDTTVRQQAVSELEKEIDARATNVAAREKAIEGKERVDLSRPVFLVAMSGLAVAILVIFSFLLF